MNKSLNVVIGLVAVVSLIVGISAYGRANDAPEVIVGSTGSQGAKGDRGETGPQGPVGPQGPRGLSGQSATPTPVLGALSSPDIPSQYLSVNGVRKEYRRMAMIAATSTPCRFLQPSGRGYLLEATIDIITGTSTAGVWTIATSTTALQYATTTALLTAFTAPASVASNVVLTGTSTGVTGRTWGGTDYLVFGVTGAPAPGFTYGGYCQAEWLML